MVSIVCFIEKKGMVGTCTQERRDCCECNFPKKQKKNEFIYRIWDEINKVGRGQQNHKGERD